MNVNTSPQDRILEKWKWQNLEKHRPSDKDMRELALDTGLPIAEVEHKLHEMNVRFQALKDLVIDPETILDFAYLDNYMAKLGRSRERSKYLSSPYAIGGVPDSDTESSGVSTECLSPMDDGATSSGDGDGASTSDGDAETYLLADSKSDASTSDDDNSTVGSNESSDTFQQRIANLLEHAQSIEGTDVNDLLNSLEEDLSSSSASPSIPVVVADVHASLAAQGKVLQFPCAAKTLELCESDSESDDDDDDGE